MLPLRSAVLRRPLAQQFSRPARAVLRTTERQSWQRVAGRRGYADAHGGTHTASSDLPWALGAVIVTIPSVWYLLQPSQSSHGDHDSHDAGHDEKHDDGGEEEAPAEEKSEDESEDKSEEKSEEGEKSEEKPDEKSDEAPKEEENKGEEKPKDDEKKGEEKGEEKPKGEDKKEEKSSEGGESKESGEGEAKEEKKSKSDGKKLSSPRSQPLGAAGDPEGINKRATNQPAKHSSDILENPEKSKKKEGAPDTAKLPGPVDPNR